MADEVIRIVTEAETTKLKDLQADLLRSREAVSDLSEQLKTMAASGQQSSVQFGIMSQFQKQFAYDAMAATKAVQVQQQQLAALGGGFKMTGQSAMQLAYVLDDVRYGFGAIVNNIPLLVQSFGGPAGLAAGLGIAAIAATVLGSHWKELQQIMFGESGFQKSAFLTELENINKEMDELAKKQQKTAQDRAMLAIGEQRKADSEKGGSYVKSVKAEQTPEESAAGHGIHEYMVQGGFEDLKKNLHDSIYNRILRGDDVYQKMGQDAESYEKSIGRGGLDPRVRQGYEKSLADIRSQMKDRAQFVGQNVNIDQEMGILLERAEKGTGGVQQGAVNEIIKMLRDKGAAGLADQFKSAFERAAQQKSNALADAGGKAIDDAEKQMQDALVRSFKEDSGKLLKAFEQGQEFDLSRVSHGTPDEQQAAMRSAVRRLDEMSAQWLGMLARMDELDEPTRAFAETVKKSIEASRDQLNKAREKLETDELNRQGQENEVAGAKEIAGAQRHTDTLKARKSRQQNLTVQMGAQAWGAEMGGVMAASAARGEKESKTDARLTGEIAERLTGLVPEDQRWDMAQRIVDAARDQYSDQAMQNRMMFGPGADPGTMMRMAQAGKLGPEGRAMAQMARGQGAGGAAMKQWAAKNRHWADMEEDQFDKKFGPFMGKDFKPEEEKVGKDPVEDNTKATKDLTTSVNNLKQKMDEGVPALMS